MKRRSQLGGCASIPALLLIAACGHFSMTEPPADWPALKVVDHGASGTLANCSQYTSPLTWPPLGCAVVYFRERICNVWAMTEWARAEELKHCEGRDHVGETTLADAWRSFKDRR